MIPMNSVEIIVPVYNAYDQLCDCLESLDASIRENRTNVSIRIIDDHSTDDRVWEKVKEFTENSSHSYEIQKNSSNQGFVRTVNLGMAQSASDVILLNTDTLVFHDWIDRLVKAATSQRNIATVTPFSNNATICSYPRFCSDNQISGTEEARELDSLMRKTNPQATIEIPTAVGFCMYIAKHALDDLGYFDAETFGKGYGEENDFSMRARSAGFINLLAADVFVAHLGGASFAEEKEERVIQAVELVNRRYPNYNTLIQAFIKEDLPKKYRLRAFLQSLQHSHKPIVLVVQHHLGGGAEKYVFDLIESTRRELSFIAMRPIHGSVVELYDPQHPCNYIRIDTGLGKESLKNFVTQLGIDHILFNHTMNVPRVAIQSLLSLAIPYDIVLHDYYLINGNPTLTDTNGKFCEDPTDRDVKCEKAYPVPDGSLQTWQQKNELFLQGATRVVAPSKYTISLFKEYYPTIQYTLAPHLSPITPIDSCRSADTIRINDREFRIVVIGALSKEKGADLLENVAVLCKKRKMPLKFYLIGYAYRELSKVVKVTGAYQDEDLMGILESIEPSAIWFPARWPETFSYTLSSALNYGSPLVIPDIGAFTERTENRPLTFVFPWNSSTISFARFFESLPDKLSEYKKKPTTWVVPSEANTVYSSDCAVRIHQRFPGDSNLLDLVEANWVEIRNRSSLSIARLLLRLRFVPPFTHLRKLLPHSIKRRVLLSLGIIDN